MTAPTLRRKTPSTTAQDAIDLMARRPELRDTKPRRPYRPSHKVNVAALVTDAILANA